MSARLLAVIAGFAVQVILARILPPDELGAYFLIQSVVATVAVFSQVGLDRPLTRDLARLVGGGRLAQARGLLILGLRLSLAPVALVSLVYALGGGSWLANTLFSSPTMAGASVAAAGWLAGMAFQNLGSAALRGFHDVGAAAFLGGALTNAVVTAVLGLLLWTEMSPAFGEILWIAAAATWLNVGLCVLLLGRRVRGLHGETVISSRELLSRALPLIAAQVAAIGFTQADLWIVGGLLSQEDVALYGAAKRMTRLVGVPLVTITLVVPPIVADLHARGESARMEAALRGSATLAGIPAALVALPFIALGGPLLGLVFGPFFAEGGMLLQILSVERLAAVVVGPCVVVLTMTGHERDVLTVVLIGGILSVVAIYLGGLLGGAVGIAWAFTGAGVLREGFSLWLVKYRLGIRTDIDLLHLGAMRDAVERALRR